MAVPQGIRKASTVECKSVITSMDTGVSRLNTYNAAVRATKRPRVISLNTMVHFLSMRSAKGPTNGPNITVGSMFMPKITADQAALPLSSYTSHVKAMASMESPNRLTTLAAMSFVYCLWRRMARYPPCLFDIRLILLR